MAFNRDSRDVASVLDQLKLGAIRIPHFTRKRAERAEDLAVAGEQRARPNRPNPVSRHPVAIVIPTRLCEDIGHINWLPAIDGSPAGRAFSTNLRPSNVIAKARKTRRNCAIEIVRSFLRKPDRAEQTFDLRFDQLGYDRQHLSEWRSGQNQLEDVHYRFA